MLQTIHRYYRSVLGALMIGAISFSMLFFGMDFGGGGNSQSAAITIGEKEISFSEFYNRKREAQDQLRRSLGQNYMAFAEQLLKNLDRQVVDSLVSEALIEQQAQELELFAGEDQVKMEFQRLFPSGLTREQYRQVLQSMGMNDAAFQHRLAKQTVQQQYQDILQDVSLASDAESLALLREAETAYDVTYVSFETDDFVSAVKAPAEENLLTFFEENATDYETKPEVSYRFVAIDPKERLDIVEVLEEDVELYYTEHTRRFSDPEKVKVRQIHLSLTPNATPDQQLGVSALADEIHEKLVAGEPFEKLAGEYSDDKASKEKGGDLGWVTKGKLDPKLEKEVFALKEGGLTDVLQSGKGYYIFSVEEYQEASPKPLDEVREEIKTLIQKAEAPAFVAAFAQELYDQWLSSGLSLEEFAKKNQLNVKEQKERAERSVDPEGFPGLTAKVIGSAGADQAFIDLREISLLVEIADFSESHIPEFDTVKKAVEDDYRRREAFTLARESANAFFAKASEEGADIATLELPTGVERKSENGLKRNAPGSGVLASSDIRGKLFSQRTPGVIGDKAISYEKAYHVVAVTKVIEPKAEDLQEKREQYQQTASTQLARNLTQSIENILRKNAEIDINAGVYE